MSTDPLFTILPPPAPSSAPSAGPAAARRTRRPWPRLPISKGGHISRDTIRRLAPTVPGRLVTGKPSVLYPARRYAVIDHCPFCGLLHWHSAGEGDTIIYTALRISRCGWPYTITLPRPRITAAGHTPGSVHHRPAPP